MQEIIYPAPGSEKALSLGCTCPVLDNHHGRGYGGDWQKYGWAWMPDCPVHGWRLKELWEDMRLYAAGKLELKPAGNEPVKNASEILF